MAVSSKNAIVNVGRLNAFRLNYVEPGLKKIRDTTLAITLDGVPLKVRLGSLSIHDVINDAPNTCTLTVDDATPPTVGGRLKVVLGVDPKYTLFVGRLQAARQSYVGRAHLDAWDCEAIDDTAQADWIRPFGAWTNVTASSVAAYIIGHYAPDYSIAGVQADLPSVTVYFDGTERLNGALRLLAKLIGGYYYFEDYVLHLFQGDEPGANPDDVTGAQLLDQPRLTATSDDAQIRTRCYGKGHGEPTLEACSVGETVIPIATAVMFNTAGGQAISEWQRLTYTGVSFGGVGALVGPGVTPSAAPNVQPADGAGVEAGAHTYAYTWVTAAGETLPSPAAVITVTGGSLPPPALDYVQSGTMPGGPPMGTVLSYALVITNGAGMTTAASAVLTLGFATGSRPVIAWTISGNMVGRQVTLYRQDNNAGGYYNVTGRVYSPNQPVGIQEIHTDMVVSSSGGGITLPTVGNYLASQVQVSGISAGPAAVTARRLYRTTAGTTTPYKLVIALADNTTLTYLDSKADAALGAAPPASDTSGLTMPAGQVLPGAAAIPVSGTGWARAAGGWAIVGNGQQILRYTGITGNQLTGIPASGPGSLTAAVNYNSTITGAPMLVGVQYFYGGTGLAGALIKGAPINLWVVVDDPAAQTALAARVGGSGIVEHLIHDERRGEPSLVALCRADLSLYSRPIVTVQYTTLDPKSRSGRPVRVHLTQPAIDQTLVIQDVTITHSGTVARFAVTASSVRTSLEDLLRRMVGTLEEGF